MAEDSAAVADAGVGAEVVGEPEGTEPAVEGDGVIVGTFGGEPFVAVVYVGGEVGAGFAFPVDVRLNVGRLDAPACARAPRAGVLGVRVPHVAVAVGDAFLDIGEAVIVGEVGDG